jgi:hypothetical protein
VSNLVEPAAPGAPPATPPDWRPAGLAQHWRELRARPAAWLALAHNLVPVVGVFLLGWSVPLVVFAFWFDGLSAIAAIVAMLVVPAMRDTGLLERRPPVVAFAAMLTWLILVGVVGLPYWVAFIPLHDYLTSPALWQELLSSPGLWATFGGVLATHVVTAARRGYRAMPERDLKQAVRWDVYLLLLRALGMFLLAGPFSFLPYLVVPAVAMLATYLEVWPARALGAVFGDPSRLHEDPERRARGGGADAPAGPRRRRRSPRR